MAGLLVGNSKMATVVLLALVLLLTVNVGLSRTFYPASSAFKLSYGWVEYGNDYGSSPCFLVDHRVNAHYHGWRYLGWPFPYTELSDGGGCDAINVLGIELNVAVFSAVYLPLSWAIVTMSTKHYKREART